MLDRNRGSFRIAASALMLSAAMVAVLPSVADAKKKKSNVVGAVFTETNGATNELLVFNRSSNGKLKLVHKVDAGGKGGFQEQPGCNPPGGCPFLDAAGEVIVTNDGKWVFAVNAGSNTIASFRVGPHNSVKRVGVADSGGVFPTSVTVHGHVLYALNNNSQNIQGFTISSKGALAKIPGSNQPVTPQHAPLSRQIGFDNTGSWLVVSQLTDQALDVFKVTGGVAGAATKYPSASAEPFGFAFDPVYNNLVTSEIVNDQDLNQEGNASSYSLDKSTGALSNISTVSVKSYAPCWVEISKNGKLAFVVNTGGPSPFGATVTTFGLGSDGKLTFNSVTAADGGFALTDEALSRNSKYLYVVMPIINNPFASPPPSTNGARINVYKVGANGKLTRIQQVNGFPPGASGIDAV